MAAKSLSWKRHALIANKMLIVMSGLSRMTKTETGYQYEKHQFGISDQFLQLSWTKSLMKQCLAYASLCTSTGHIALVSEEELAQAMKCSVRTVQQNNMTLEQHGIIQWDRIWGAYIEVSLCDYLKHWLDLHPKHDAAAESFEEELAEEYLSNFTSKGGYTSLSQEMVLSLLALDHVNELRLAFRGLYNYEKQVNVKKETEAIVSYSEIKHVLPRYTSHKAAIRRMGEKLRSIFTIEWFEKEEIIHTFYEEKRPNPSLLSKLKDGFVVSFNVTGAFDSKTQKARDIMMTEHAFIMFQKFFQSYGSYSIDRSFVRKMALVYGAEVMEKALRALQNEIQTMVHGATTQGIKAFSAIKDQINDSIQRIANGYDMAKKAV